MGFVLQACMKELLRRCIGIAPTPHQFRLPCAIAIRVVRTYSLESNLYPVGLIHQIGQKAERHS